LRLEEDPESADASGTSILNDCRRDSSAPKVMPWRQKPVYDDDLANLEEGLRRLKVEYHIFFNGNRKKPPDDMRMRVEKLIKRLSESSDLSVTQRFRFNTLITRFYVYRDLWRRTMLEREMGAEPKGEKMSGKVNSLPSAITPVESTRVSLSDPKCEEEKIRRLYDALLRIRRAGGQESSVSYQQFAKYVTTQTDAIRKKHGCARVAFTVALEEDAIRFTAAAEIS
jgi:hypothetical protein